MDDLIERELDKKKQGNEGYVNPALMDKARFANLQHLT